MLALLVIVLLIAADIAWTLVAVKRIEAESPPRGVFADIDGGRIHVVRRDPAGPIRADVLLLHGASGNHADMMEALGDPLAARGFRVWAADRPGHGYSDRADADTPSAQATRVRAAMERLGVRKSIVVGHSLGGAVADAFAIDHGDFAQGVVLLSPVTHPWPGGITWYYNAAAFGPLGALFAWTLALPAGLAVIDTAVKGVFKPQTPPENYIARTGAKLVLRPQEFIANAKDVAGLKAFVTEQSPREKDVRVPVAIVAGDETDTIVSTKIHSVASSRAIPGATLKILPGVGHSPHWAAPDVVAAAVEEVFARGRGQAAAD